MLKNIPITFSLFRAGKIMFFRPSSLVLSCSVAVTLVVSAASIKDTNTVSVQYYTDVQCYCALLCNAKCLNSILHFEKCVCSNSTGKLTHTDI